MTEDPYAGHRWLIPLHVYKGNCPGVAYEIKKPAGITLTHWGNQQLLALVQRYERANFISEDLYWLTDHAAHSEDIELILTCEDMQHPHPTCRILSAAPFLQVPATQKRYIGPKRMHETLGQEIRLPLKNKVAKIIKQRRLLDGGINILHDAGRIKGIHIYGYTHKKDPRPYSQKYINLVQVI